jgi:LacI family transcriptional regulator
MAKHDRLQTGRQAPRRRERGRGSLRTASRVLNDDPRVAPVTRQRVQAAMLDLRFEPDAMARSLRAGTDTSIGFVVESISDPFFAEVIDAVELEMSRHGRSVLVTSTRRDPAWERDVIGRMVQRRVAGLLLCPTGDDHAWLDPRVPVVLVDRPAARPAGPTWSRSTITARRSAP